MDAFHVKKEALLKVQGPVHALFVQLDLIQSKVFIVLHVLLECTLIKEPQIALHVLKELRTVILGLQNALFVMQEHILSMECSAITVLRELTQNKVLKISMIVSSVPMDQSLELAQVHARLVEQELML